VTGPDIDGPRTISIDISYLVRAALARETDETGSGDAGTALVHTSG